MFKYDRRWNAHISLDGVFFYRSLANICNATNNYCFRIILCQGYCLVIGELGVLHNFIFILYANFKIFEKPTRVLIFLRRSLLHVNYIKKESDEFYTFSIRGRGKPLNLSHDFINIWFLNFSYVWCIFKELLKLTNRS